MNEKIAILTDSGSDVPADIAKELGIFVLPLQVIYQNRSYLDGVDIDAQSVYDRLPVEVPSTSLPTGEYVDKILKQIKEQGYTHILAVVLSSGLSGTCNFVRLMAQESKIPFHVIDTKNIGIGSGLSVIKAAKLVKEGGSFSDVIAKVEAITSKTKVFFVLSTLEYLKKGGRIGKVMALLGTTFDLKPIITCNEEGIYTTVTKARGRKASLKRLQELVYEFTKDATHVNIGFSHGDAFQEITVIKEEMLKQLISIQNVYFGQVSPALGVHTGPGLIGIGVQIDE